MLIEVGGSGTKMHRNESANVSHRKHKETKTVNHPIICYLLIICITSHTCMMFGYHRSVVIVHCLVIPTVADPKCLTRDLTSRGHQLHRFFLNSPLKSLNHLIICQMVWCSLIICGVFMKPSEV